MVRDPAVRMRTATARIGALESLSGEHCRVFVRGASRPGASANAQPSFDGVSQAPTAPVRLPLQAMGASLRGGIMARHIHITGWNQSRNRGLRRANGETSLSPLRDVLRGLLELLRGRARLTFLRRAADRPASSKQRTALRRRNRPAGVAIARIRDPGLAGRNGTQGSPHCQTTFGFAAARARLYRHASSMLVPPVCHQHVLSDAGDRFPQLAHRQNETSRCRAIDPMPVRANELAHRAERGSCSP